MPYAPWYWPCACAGARPKEMPQPAAACHSSPTTCTSAPASSSGTATVTGTPPPAANSTQAPASRMPARRAARPAPVRSSVPREARTWNRITTTVLTSRQTEISQFGAVVCPAIHSGRAMLISEKCMDMSPSSTVKARNGRSRSAISRGPCAGAGIGGTGGSRSSTAAAST